MKTLSDLIAVSVIGCVKMSLNSSSFSATEEQCLTYIFLKQIAFHKITFRLGKSEFEQTVLADSHDER
jgi:hypothetical protein